MKPLSKFLFIVFFVNWIVYGSVNANAENIYVGSKKVVYTYPRMVNRNNINYQVVFANPREEGAKEKYVNDVYFVPTKLENGKLKAVPGEDKPETLKKITVKTDNGKKCLYGITEWKKPSGEAEKREMKIPDALANYLLDLYLGLTDLNVSSGGHFDSLMRQSLSDDPELSSFFKLSHGNIFSAVRLYKAQNYLAAAEILSDMGLQAGNPQAQYLLGDMYLYKKGWYNEIKKVKKLKKPDKIKAYVTQEGLDWLRMAAKQGYEPAIKKLGNHLLYFNNTAEEYNEAIEMLELLGNNGDLESQKTLGHTYWVSTSLTPSYYNIDTRKAIYWYEKAALQGDLSSMYSVALCLKEVIDKGKDGTEQRNKDIENYKKWSERMVAENYADGLYNMGFNYDAGKWGYPGNEDKALSYYKQAADKGHKHAKESYDHIMNLREIRKGTATASNQTKKNTTATAKKTTTQTAKKTTTTASKSTSSKPASSASATSTASQKAASQPKRNSAETLVKEWNNTTGTMRTNYKEYGDGRLVATTYNQCFACYGNRTCRLCSGTGMQYAYTGNRVCGMCFGNGQCSACHGKGETVVVTVTQNGETQGATLNGPIRHPGAGSSSGSSSSSSSKSTTSTSSASSSSNSGYTVQRRVQGYHRNGSTFYTVEILKNSSGDERARLSGYSDLLHIVRSDDSRWKYCVWQGNTWVYFSY